jgi:hypothetical protein
MQKAKPGEAVREFYRAQGERRFAELVIAELEELHAYRADALWSARYLINLIGEISENRTNQDSRTNT